MDYLKNYKEPDKTCQFGSCDKQGVWRRQNTQYEDDKSNWGCFCEEHQAEADEYWRGMWIKYYRDVL